MVKTLSPASMLLPSMNIIVDNFVQNIQQVRSKAFDKVDNKTQVLNNFEQIVRFHACI